MTTIVPLPDAVAPLEEETARQAFADMLDGRVGDEAVAAFLTQIAQRGETSLEIVAAARAMRERMIPITAPDGAIDVCGTGGDGSHSLNVSTAVAIVVAACGVPVAKHGNRASSSRSGAADTLEAAGLDLDVAAATGERSLAEIGIAFLFAPAHHPALKRLAPIRRAIRRRTIFNLVGPLVNPARVTRQLVGIADPSLLGTYAEALRLLGSVEAMVVVGEEPLDELSVSGPTRIMRVDVAGLREERIEPRLAGLPTYPPEALQGGDARYNADALRQLLRGEKGAYRDAVLLNSAAALMLAGHANSWEDAVEEARETIDAGLAAVLFDRWIAYR